MKMNKTRIGSAILCFLLTVSVLSVFSSCKNGTNDVPQSTTVQSADPSDPYANYMETLGEKSWQDERTFRIAVTQTDPGDFFASHSEDNFSGYSVSDAMFKRDQFIMSATDTVIEYVYYSKGDDCRSMQTAISNSCYAGMPICEMIVANLTPCLLTLQSQGYLNNINALPHIDDDNPWWSPYFIEGASYNDKLFFTSGMASGGIHYATIYAMMCNLKLAQDVVMEDGSSMDIFQLVEDGEWTLDVFESIIKDYSKDLDSNGTFSVYDDLMAYAHCRSDVTAACHFIAAGMQFSTFNNDGEIVVKLSNETNGNMVEKLAGIFDIIKDNFDHTAFFSKDVQVTSFLNNRALFFGNSMSFASRLPGMESDYAIIPCPKGSSEQDTYYSGINVWTPGYIGVPTTATDGDFVGYMMEALGYTSYIYVKPALYDSVLCLRLAKDERQISIMDQIYEGLYVDLNFLHNFGTSAGVVEQCIMDKEMQYSSSMGMISKVIGLDIEKFENSMK